MGKKRSTKQRIHDWLYERARTRKPLPDQDQMRHEIEREVGKELADAEREEQERNDSYGRRR